MRLLFKQRVFSWFDSYDIYDEAGNTVFTVKGQLAWGHCFKVFDTYGNEVAMLKEKIFSFMPAFEIYIEGRYVGRIKKEFTFFKPVFNLDFNGWRIEGDIFQWDYSVYDGIYRIMTVSKRCFNWSDTYLIDVYDDENVLSGLMIALAIDAEKDTGN